ncbi:MAG: YegP family protein [Solirubrobacteraceae bacterium]
MATATKNARAANQVVRGAGEASKSTSMEFVISEDNGGRYDWRIVAGNGGILARSEGFASYEDAEHAAHRVRDGAASASFKPGTGENEPVGSRRAPGHGRHAR